MQVNNMTLKSWMMKQYQMNTGGVNITRTSQLEKDIEDPNDPLSAVKITISAEAKKMNAEFMKHNRSE